MKKILLISFIAAMALFFTASVFAATQPETSKIGIFDMQKIVRESKTGQQAKAVFERELEQKRNMLQEKEKSITVLEDNLKKDTTLPAAKRKEKEEEFSRELKELKRLRADLEEELKKKDIELASGIIKRILEIARNIGAQEKYTLILQKGMDVIYIDKAVDLTPKITEKLDAQSKK